jgi:hypothetical protein
VIRYSPKQVKIALYKDEISSIVYLKGNETICGKIKKAHAQASDRWLDQEERYSHENFQAFILAKCRLNALDKVSFSLL